MSELNRRLALRWMQEVWNDRREETIDELLTPESVGHMEGVDVHGAGPFRQARAELLAAFPDLNIVVEETIADGDNVALRWHVTGTHLGHALGLKPSNRPVTFRGLTWYRFKDGRIIEGWDAWNQGKLLAELIAAQAV